MQLAAQTPARTVRPQASLRPARTPAVIIRRMAEKFATTAENGGGITREELLVEFSGAEIDAHLEAAKAKARNLQAGRA